MPYFYYFLNFKLYTIRKDPKYNIYNYCLTFGYGYVRYLPGILTTGRTMKTWASSTRSVFSITRQSSWLVLNTGRIWRLLKRKEQLQRLDLNRKLTDVKESPEEKSPLFYLVLWYDLFMSPEGKLEFEPSHQFQISQSVQRLPEWQFSGLTSAIIPSFFSSFIWIVADFHMKSTTAVMLVTFCHVFFPTKLRKKTSAAVSRFSLGAFWLV